MLEDGLRAADALAGGGGAQEWKRRAKSGFLAVLRKEWLHMLRDRGTLRFALAVPAMQLVLFGLIDTNVRDVPTVLVDHSRSAESRLLIEQLEATSLFQVIERLPSADAMREAIVAGRASVGIEIPPDFHRAVLDRRTATFLVLIDGSDSTLSSQALAAANGLALSRSLADCLLEAGGAGPALEARPRILFNPDSRSANLLIPGLVAILLTFSGTLLAAFAIVRERGTLEQLMVRRPRPSAWCSASCSPTWRSPWRSW